MKTQEIIKTLRRMAVNTGTLNCLGCGYEHNCGVHGCRVLREAADRLEQLQNNQRWHNPKDKLPEPDTGVLAIVSGKPHTNITLVGAYCIAEYDVQDGWIVSDYPESTTLKVEAWMPLPSYSGEVADNLEELQAENDPLFRSEMESKSDSGLLEE